MSKKVMMLSFTAAMVLVATSLAQQSAPAAPAASSDAKDAPAAAPAQQPAYETSAVLKVKTRLVVVDVVARDAKGAPVTDLKQEDFTVIEDGKEQKLRIFNFQHPDDSVATAPPQSPANRENVVDNLPHFKPGRALNVILMDALNTSRLNQVAMRQAMVKFLETLPANEPIAVYLLGDKIRLLQDFTTDPAVLKDVVRSFKGKSSPLLAVSADGSPIAPILPGVAQSLPPGMAGQIRAFQDQMTADITDQRVQVTLAALNSLSRTLSGYPGRKNLIWISETFPFDVMLSSATGRSSLNDRNYSHEIARTGNMLSDSQVAIYPLDARGLAVSGFFNVANSADQYGNGLAGSTLRGGMSSSMDREADDRMAAHGTMNDLADRTGGRAFYNRNDLDGAVRDSITHGSTYYTLGYYPENKEWNGSFRKIQVKLNRGGVKLRYRVGYFAMDSAAFAKLSPKRQDEDFDDAMTLNIPVSTALPFQAVVTPPSAKTQNKVVVTYRVDPHALSFETGNDGLQAVNMECAVRVFPKKNPDKALTTEAQKMGGALNAEAYAKVMKGFFPCRDQLTLQPGDYLLRLGVRDNVTGLIGTANASLTIPEESSSASPSAPPGKP
ncbi:MAG TPA: VWA domain-containing protein [Candidatus Angelobacter sp.]|nr:VWA domain-containing protein [Candidatus Angelobacter sp.]